ncbi:terminase [Corynebacterium propinquum]|nr:terminase [Corynebacterium propinquum]
MPWQQFVADVIGEVDPDTGLFRWPTVILSVPRQSGKTTLVLAACIQRLLVKRDARVWFTAQNGMTARKKWLELVEKVQGGAFPLSPLFKTRKSQGSEALQLPRLGGQFSPHPPTEDSLHSMQSDLNIIDEGWVFDDAEAAALMQAIVPTQATRPGAQTIIVSTMGTARSTWFHGLVAKAKQPGSNIALLEWGIQPGDDPTDLDIIAAAHPAFGSTITMKSLQDAKDQLAPSEFARAYGNRATGARERLIPLESWESAQTTEPIPASADVSIAAAIDFDRSETCVAACAIVDGIPVIEVIDLRPGTGWAAERVAALVEKHSTAPPVVDNVGPSGTLYDQLCQLDCQPMKFGARDLTRSCADLMDRLTRITEDGIAAPDIRFRPHDGLDLAAEIAEQRHVGDAWAWDRKSSAGSIAALEAATLAMFGALHRPAEAVAPAIY